MAIQPDTYDITIYTGADRVWNFQITDDSGAALPLPGWTVKGQIRAKWGLGEVLVAEFDVDCSGIGTDGTFILSLSRVTTRNITVKKGYYDIFLTGPDGKARPYIRGEVTIEQSVTDVDAVI